MPRVSPSRKPATSARVVGGSDRVPRRISARIEFATASRPCGADSCSTVDFVDLADGMAPPRPIVVRTGAQRREPAREHDVVTGFDHSQRSDVVAGRPGRQRAVRAVTGIDAHEHARRVHRTARILGGHAVNGDLFAPFDRADDGRVRLPVEGAAHHRDTEQRARDGGERAAPAGAGEPGRAEGTRRRGAARRRRQRLRTARPRRCRRSTRRARPERAEVHLRPSRDRAVAGAWRRRCRARDRGRSPIGTDRPRCGLGRWPPQSRGRHPATCRVAPPSRNSG